jgi:P-type E1-E2 ATPase
MISFSIPGLGDFSIAHLVSDVNGTIAVDGVLVPGVAEAFHSLAEVVDIHLLTADTHGRQKALDEQLGLAAVRIPSGAEADAKAEYVRKLPGGVVAIGQGANDAGMLEAADVGICVSSQEGTAVETLLKADLFVPDILAGLDLLLKPVRLTATLRR